MTLRVIVLLLLLYWPLAAFGGSDASTAVPWALVCVCWLLVLHPRLSGTLDVALLVVLGAIALQLVPWPSPLVRVLLPHAAAVRARLAPTGHADPFTPLSIRPAESEWALLVVVGAVALFWIARKTFSQGGVRRTVRGIVIASLVVSALGILQVVAGGYAVYWTFPTAPGLPVPLGPFRNRNHFASWLVMTLPICAGYLTARLAAERRMALETRSSRTSWTDPRDVLTHPRTGWLLVTAATMSLALVASMSRSGMIAVGLVALAAALAMRRATRAGRLLLACGALIMLGLGWASLPAIARGGPAASGLSQHVAMWWGTLPVVGDFWTVGTGAGTYRTAMLAYAPGDFSRGENNYLRLLIEGGVLVALPALVALVLFVLSGIRALRADASTMRSVRVGAACGLAAVLIQSVSDIGLTVPANAALAATLAAIVVHQRES